MTSPPRKVAKLVACGVPLVEYAITPPSDRPPLLPSTSTNARSFTPTMPALAAIDPADIVTPKLDRTAADVDVKSPIPSPPRPPDGQKTGKLCFDVPVAALGNGQTFVDTTELIRGVKWGVTVFKDVNTAGKPSLCFALRLVGFGSTKCRCRHIIRILSTRQSFGVRRPIATYQINGEHQTSERCAVIEWTELVDASNGFVHDGKLTLEVDIVAEEPEYVDDRAAWSIDKIADFDRLMCTDMRVEVGAVEIKCHKEVLCKYSKVFSRLLANEPASVAYPCHVSVRSEQTTPEIVSLFFRAMYEGWTKRSMDRWATELLKLAKRFGCDKVVVSAKEALKRMIAPSTFWRTLHTAVDMGDKQLVKACAMFANRSTFGLKKLLQTEEGQKALHDHGDTTVQVLMTAWTNLETNSF